MNYKFRDLRADEIDCRPATINEKGCALLLYKDARVDMNILDETVGCMNWKKEYRRDNANCILSIYDTEKREWVGKEDTGVESYTEKEKGLASDSFKRAGFCWGIGRELYTAPFIWIPSVVHREDGNTEMFFQLREGKNGNKTTYDKFAVEQIIIEDKKIVALSIRNTSLNKRVFVMDNREKEGEK